MLWAVPTRPRRDEVEIRGLRVGCIVGVRPDERLVEQPVDVDLSLGLDLRAAGRSGRIGATCDYDRVAEEVTAMLKFRRFRLLESAAEEVATMLLGVHRDVEEVRVSLEKPRALDGRARGARVSIQRNQGDVLRRRERTQFGEAEVLLETAEAGLYLLHIAPGRSIPPHRHAVMRELEWRVRGRLLRDGRALEGLAVVEWPRGRVHGYENPSDEVATLFCCDVPPFMAEDEIEVSDEPRARAEEGPS